MEKNKNIHYSRTDRAIGLIEFDFTGKTVNLFSMEVLEELSEIIDSIREGSDIRGLVFLSRKPNHFIGGAQIEPDKLLGDPPETTRFIQKGRDVFSSISSLPFPTLAAIHGACLGGGLELTLACAYRIASTHSKTRLGLPEVMLGILPAWGGTTRLPRLVGLRRALDLLLTGKQVPAASALRMGLVDRLATTREIPIQALSFLEEILEGGPEVRRKILHARSASQKGPVSWFLDRTVPGRSMVFRKTREAVLNKTKGRYPAPLMILDIVRTGIRSPIEKALPLEQEGIEKLMRNEVTESLMHVFSLRMGAGKIGSDQDGRLPRTGFHKVGVLGAGAMGSGIAQWLLGRGLQVRLKDINEQAVSAGIRSINKTFEKLVSRRRMTRLEKEGHMHRLSPTTRYTGFSTCELVIEAVAERLDIKKTVIRELQQAAGAEMIFGTNTSSLSVDEIARDSGNPSKVLGLHFFNPVSQMPLVEIVRGRETSPETLSRGVDFVKAIGKIPLIVSDSPGFLVNRILMAYANEAGLLLEEGAGVERIDRAIEDFGMAMGPFRMMDVVGLDIAHHTGESIRVALKLDPRQQAKIGAVLFEKGILGDKTGGGFYTGTRGNPTSNTRVLEPELAAIRKEKGITPRSDIGTGELVDRLILIMLNTAAWCIEQKVVDGPEGVDLGLIMGAGFPPFRGGLLKYFDRTGLEEPLRKMKLFEQQAGTRYRPSEILTAGQTAFY